MHNNIILIFKKSHEPVRKVLQINGIAIVRNPTIIKLALYFSSRKAPLPKMAMWTKHNKEVKTKSTREQCDIGFSGNDGHCSNDSTCCYSDCHYLKNLYHKYYQDCYFLTYQLMIQRVLKLVLFCACSVLLLDAPMHYVLFYCTLQ